MYKQQFNSNISKNKTMTFLRKINCITYNYKISDTIIPRCDSVQEMGITFNDHIDNIVLAGLKILDFVERNIKGFNDI